MQYSRHTWIAHIFSQASNENMTIKSLQTVDISMLSYTVSCPSTKCENKLGLSWTLKQQGHYFRCHKVRQRPRNGYYWGDPIESSGIPVRKICTISSQKHSLQSPWSILIAISNSKERIPLFTAYCKTLGLPYCSTCLLCVPCICDIFPLRNDSWVSTCNFF